MAVRLFAVVPVYLESFLVGDGLDPAVNALLRQHEGGHPMLIHRAGHLPHGQ